MHLRTRAKGGHRWAGLPLAARLAWAVAAPSLLVLAVVLATRAVAGTSGGAAPMGAETRDWVLALLCTPLGARIAAHSQRNACGWLVLAVGALSAATVGVSELPSATATWLAGWLWWPGHGLLVLVALLFPDGRPVSPRWRWVTWLLTGSTAVGTLALASLTARAPDLLAGQGEVPAGPDTVALLAGVATLVLGALCAVVALGVRIARSPSEQRPPLVWAVVNAAVLLAALVLDAFAGVPLAWLFGALAVPAVTVVGVLRYGLYDIDTLVHRSLVYGLACAALLVLYPLAVVAVGRVVPGPTAAAAVAVALVALLPLRDGVQRFVHRRLYGLSAHPYELLETLGRRIGAAQLPEDVLQEAVGAIGTALRLPFVAVRLEGRPDPEATSGTRRPWAVTPLELAYRGRQIGELVVQQRSPDERWSQRERRLLLGLARQLAPSAAAVRLTRDLQDARERLVRAREEELRRLQRDLHDGIGAALTGGRMTARAALSQQGQDVTALLERLEDDLADAATQLRHVIEGLRPPALDRGLAAALETAARRHRRPGLQIDVMVDGAVPAMPAAVEVAAYRVAEEALANVAKHARAGHATVALAADPRTLTLEVRDDGAGPAEPRSGSVGVESMRERCQELGGVCTVTRAEPGTRVTAVLPLG